MVFCCLRTEIKVNALYGSFTLLTAALKIILLMSFDIPVPPQIKITPLFEKRCYVSH